MSVSAQARFCGRFADGACSFTGNASFEQIRRKQLYDRFGGGRQGGNEVHAERVPLRRFGRRSSTRLRRWLAG
jgi:hypothetical protein